MNNIKPKKFDFSNIIGLSYSQLFQHYQLYKGYVKNINITRNKLNNNKTYEKPNSTYSKLRCAVKAESYSINGSRLHELYFENLTGKNIIPYGKILKLIIDKYGDYNNFVKQFKDTALSVRGWVLLSIDRENNDIYIFGQDSHDDGFIVSTYPLIVLDVYEHAYMIDYGIDKEKYLQVFFNNIDYNIINRRLRKYYN